MRIEAKPRAYWNANGLLVWQGPSLLDGVEIALVVTGLTTASSNSKTADMLQTHIVVVGMTAREALANGCDVSICGDCPHRSVASGGDATCYVHDIIKLAKGTEGVSAALMRGSYRTLDTYPAKSLAKRTAGRKLRYGTYGDPAAVPVEAWQKLAELTGADLPKGRTGYTHQWRDRPDLACTLMASVDTAEEQAEASAAGWRTFRIITDLAHLMPHEALCPASKEAGQLVTCDSCGLCNGNPKPDGRVARSIAIVEH